MNTCIWKDFHFDAAHWLPHVPEGHKCRRMHGHTYRVRVWCRGLVDERGMIVDYAIISDKANIVISKQLDHRVLNEIDGLENPTTENLARWILERIALDLPELFRVEVSESASSGCTVERL